MVYSPHSLAHLCGLSAFSSTASLSLFPDLIDVPIAAEPERDLGIREERSELLLAAQGKTLRPRKNAVAYQRFSFQTSTGGICCSPKIPYVLIAKDQMILFPVRMSGSI